jgi:membrane fusion protein, multidrug efflux system
MPPDANASALTRGRVAEPVDDRVAVRHTRRRWPFILLLLAAAIVGTVMYQRSRASQTTGAAAGQGRRPQNMNVPVGVAAASLQDVPVKVSALGSVSPFNTVTVRPRVDGQLMQVGFQEGQFVRKGDLLAVIDPRPFQVQLEQAEGQLARDESQLANAKTQLARYQLLLKEDSIARSSVDDQAAMVAQLEGAMKVDRAAIDSAKLNLTYTRVTAPINGRVGLRLVDVGNIVSASSQTGLVVITEIEPIAVLFTVPEDNLRLLLPKIRDNSNLPVDVFDRSGQTHLATGKVLTLDNQIDPSTGTVRIKAMFDNKDHALFPAQFVNVQVLADTKRNQIVVPAVAVQHGPQSTFVYTIKEGKAVVRPVTVGLVDGDRATITGGLEAGEQVITDSTDRLREGSAVEIRAPGAGGGDAGHRGQSRGQGQGRGQEQGRGTHQRPTP